MSSLVLLLVTVAALASGTAMPVYIDDFLLDTALNTACSDPTHATARNSLGDCVP